MFAFTVGGFCRRFNNNTTTLNWCSALTLKTTGKKLSGVCPIAVELRMMRMMRDAWYCPKLQYSNWNGIVDTLFFQQLSPRSRLISDPQHFPQNGWEVLESLRITNSSVYVWIRLSVFVSPDSWPTEVCFSPDVCRGRLEPSATLNKIRGLANWLMAECLWHEHVLVPAKR